MSLQDLSAKVAHRVINKNSYDILEKISLNKKLLSKENLHSVILSKNVFGKIRDELKMQDCSSTDDEIKDALQKLLHQ